MTFAETAPGADGMSDGPTVSHLLGEMTWLLSQSPLHGGLTLTQLDWLVMAPLAKRQFYIFRDGVQPIGLALWARCGPSAAAKLQAGMLEPENHLTFDDWSSGPDVWLVDLVAPFATAQNRHRELMIADLIAGPLSGKAFRFHQTDPATGQRTVQVIAADAAEKLKAAIESSLAEA